MISDQPQVNLVDQIIKGHWAIKWYKANTKILFNVAMQVELRTIYVDQVLIRGAERKGYAKVV